MTGPLDDFIYPERIATALRVNGQRVEDRARLARLTATRCGWCGTQTNAGAPCCGAEPWRNQ